MGHLSGVEWSTRAVLSSEQSRLSSSDPKDTGLTDNEIETVQKYFRQRLIELDNKLKAEQ